MQKPFDVNTIMEDLDASLIPEAHDTTRARLSNLSSPERDDGTRPLRDIPPRSPNPPAAIQTEQGKVAEDAINPSHYRKHPSGIECIEITRHLNFNVGNAIKYLWRYQDKGNPVENLQKAQWYIDDEIRRLQGLR